MRTDVIVIGAGLSGLTAASLLSKRGLKVLVVDKSHNPGGSCGIFKRDDVVFDQGSAMLYGFGEAGFNAHRFVMNCLEEPINIIRHDLLYVVNYQGHRIRFWPDVDRFAEELAGIFPKERVNIHRFYRDMKKLYHNVMEDNQTYTTADETDPKVALKSLLKHPISYAKFLGYLNRSAEDLLKQYFDDPEIFKFFNKLTSTYCYATVAEAPAVLAAVMFVDNHVGGSYYPAGSTVFLPGKLEKVIEDHDGEMMPDREVTEILFEGQKPVGVRLDNGEEHFAEHIVYSGTVWNLYGKLIGPEHVDDAMIQWALDQQPTYPSVVLYSTVDGHVLPEDTAPVELLVGNPDMLDESEVTVYMFGLDDHSLCPDGLQVVIAIGPTFEEWDASDEEAYTQMKELEKQRLVGVLEKRFPGFAAGIHHAEISTPHTIERYCLKNGGAVAGPKQMLGQHMLRRQHTKTKWDTLYCCGESTVMGTGTPTVTVSGLSAANAILKKLEMQQYIYNPAMKNYIRMVEKPYPREKLFEGYSEETRDLMTEAWRCQFCENPSCAHTCDIPGIMRRITVGNLTGADKLVRRFLSQEEQAGSPKETWETMENNCVLCTKNKKPVAIGNIVKRLQYERETL